MYRLQKIYEAGISLMLLLAIAAQIYLVYQIDHQQTILLEYSETQNDYYLKAIDTVLTEARRYKMLTFKNTSEKAIINGYYDPNNDFYCVWTAGRNESDIERTEAHERCHAFIDEDYMHFCGD